MDNEWFDFMNEEWVARMKEKREAEARARLSERKALEKAAKEYNSKNPFPFKIGEMIVRVFDKTQGQIYLIIGSAVPHGRMKAIEEHRRRYTFTSKKVEDIGWMVEVLALPKTLPPKKLTKKQKEAGVVISSQTKVKPRKKKKVFISRNAISHYSILAQAPILGNLPPADPEPNLESDL